MNRLSAKYKTFGNFSCSKFHTKRLLSISMNNTWNITKKIEGSFLKHWLKYWKNVYSDYKEVFISIIHDIKIHPIRSTVWLTFSGTCYYMSQHNPNERMFREQLIKDTQKLLLVGDPVQNPVSTRYVKWLEKCYNEQIIRQTNLGIFSLLWIHDHDENCALYKTMCPYLQPNWFKFPERIIDVGFLDTWWILKKYMTNYDINDSGNT